MNSKLLFVVAALGMLAFARCGSPEPVNKTKLEPSVNLTKVGDAEKTM